MNMNHVIKTFMHKTGVKIDCHIAKTAQLVEAAAPRPSFFFGGGLSHYHATKYSTPGLRRDFYPYTP